MHRWFYASSPRLVVVWMTNNYWEARDSEVFRQGLNAGYKQGYRHGLEDGHKQGWNAADAAAESHAEHAARLFYTMEAGESWHRQAAKSAHDAISVVAARETQRRGGARA